MGDVGDDGRPKYLWTTSDDWKTGEELGDLRQFLGDTPEEAIAKRLRLDGTGLVSRCLYIYLVLNERIQWRVQ